MRMKIGKGKRSRSTPPERQLVQDARFRGIRSRTGHPLLTTSETDGAARDEQEQEGGEGDPET